jgi:hypothetical protein
MKLHCDDLGDEVAIGHLSFHVMCERRVRYGFEALVSAVGYKTVVCCHLHCSPMFSRVLDVVYPSSIDVIYT